MPQGTVAWFNTEKGFGFLTPDGGGTDVFVHVREVGGALSLDAGARVEYDTKPGDRGPHAIRVRVVAAAPAVAARPVSAPPRRPARLRDGASGRGPGSAPAPPLEGKVSWFDEERGFGFLLPDDGGVDVFVHVSQLADGAASLTPGERVAFTRSDGERGPQAGDVRCLDRRVRPGARPAAAAAGRTPTRPGGRVLGTVSWFDPVKGFGFVVPDDGGGDAFLHVSQIEDDGAYVEADDRVELTLAQGDRGRQAERVRRVGGAVEPAGVGAGGDDDRALRANRGGQVRVAGVVSWFDGGKGFGFLTPDAGGDDVFVHFTQVVGDSGDPLTEGQRVEFGVVQGERGPQAAEVRRA